MNMWGLTPDFLDVLEEGFKEFFENLDAGTQDKILYVLMLLQTQDRIPLKFMKLIEEGLYELRIEYQSNIYRIFFCFDEGRIVILFNGFQKKTEKTPKKEIDKAKILRKEYYGSKNK